jgi:tRNA(Ile)-lysidine synthase
MKRTNGLADRFERYCREKSLLRKGDGIIVAVSGGVDSVVLLDLFSRLKNKYDLRLRVAHFNHQLRGKESDTDEMFVRKLAKRHGYQFAVDRADTAAHSRHRKTSIQDTARELRYRFLTNLLKEDSTHKIATAHNANDNAETLLLNLCRGTGISGLSGIPVYRPDLHLIRPLLFAARSEIEAYAKLNRLRYRTDSSNKKLYYKRNFIRKKILPLLQESLNPDIIETLNRTSDIFSRVEDLLLQEAKRHLEHLTEKKTNDLHSLDLTKLKEIHRYLQESVVELVARSYSGVPLESKEVSRILGLLASVTGKRIEVSKGFKVYRDRRQLIFVRKRKKLELEEEVRPDKRYEFGPFRFSSETIPREDVRWAHDRHIEYIDADRLNNRLLLRTWKKGDWFIPFGMEKPKKLSDFFIDEKIPRYEKEAIPLLESHGNIVWVCGVRLDNRYRIGPTTRNVLKLEFEDKEL